MSVRSTNPTDALVESARLLDRVLTPREHPASSVRNAPAQSITISLASTVAIARRDLTTGRVPAAARADRSGKRPRNRLSFPTGACFLAVADGPGGHRPGSGRLRERSHHEPASADRGRRRLRDGGRRLDRVPEDSAVHRGGV